MPDCRRARENVFLSIADREPRPGCVRPSRERLTSAATPTLTSGLGGASTTAWVRRSPRLETRIVIRTVLDRFPAMTLAGPPPTLVGNVLGFGRRPVRVHLG